MQGVLIFYSVPISDVTRWLHHIIRLHITQAFPNMDLGVAAAFITFMVMTQ